MSMEQAKMLIGFLPVGQDLDASDAIESICALLAIGQLIEEQGADCVFVSGHATGMNDRGQAVSTNVHVLRVNGEVVDLWGHEGWEAVESSAWRLSGKNPSGSTHRMLLEAGLTTPSPYMAAKAAMWKAWMEERLLEQSVPLSPAHRKPTRF